MVGEKKLVREKEVVGEKELVRGGVFEERREVQVCAERPTG